MRSLSRYDKRQVVRWKVYAMDVPGHESTGRVARRSSLRCKTAINELRGLDEREDGGAKTQVGEACFRWWKWSGRGAEYLGRNTPISCFRSATETQQILPNPQIFNLLHQSTRRARDLSKASKLMHWGYWVLKLVRVRSGWRVLIESMESRQVRHSGCFFVVDGWNGEQERGKAGRSGKKLR
jgi:hypothetical protein